MHLVFCLYKPIIIQHTHSIFERWHDFHLFSGDSKLVGVNVVGGATRLFLSISLHRCTAILPVQRHTDHSRKISLENTQHHQNVPFNFGTNMWVRPDVHTLGQSSPAYPALTEYEPMSNTRAPTSSVYKQSQIERDENTQNTILC